jgi:cysteine desulfurase
MSNINKIRPIYLDYAATTPIDERVLQKMLPYMQQEGMYGNPASSTHVYGWQAKEAVETARRMIAKRLGAQNKEIIFTSGATESNNLAIIGVAEGYSSKGKHIITSLTEHKAVLDTCKYLETRGYEITYLEPEADGLISLNKINMAIRTDTILLSLMHVNNETGVMQDIAKIGELASSKNILFHVDAAQSVGKFHLDLANLKIDLLSISGHKMYGPKGIGALYIKNRSRINLKAQMHGGAHEFGFRSGTLPTHQIIGMAYALKYSILDLEQESSRLQQFEQKLLQELFVLGGIHLNGHATQRKPGHINISVEGVEGESLLASLNKIAISSGSACNSAVAASSHVLKAMQVSPQLAGSALRISMGRFTSAAQVDIIIEHLTNVIVGLRAISPLSINA